MEYIGHDSSHHVVNGCLALMAVAWILTQLTGVSWCDVISMTMVVACDVWITAFALFAIWHVILDIFVTKTIFLLYFYWRLIVACVIELVHEL